MIAKHTFRATFAWVALLLGILFPATAGAQTMVKATIGWGDALRLGRWTPVFITVADAHVRAVTLEIHGVSGKSAAMCVRQRATAQPLPTTYALLYPLNGDLADTAVIVRDEVTGKTLASQVLEDYTKFSPAGQTPVVKLQPEETLIGLSGSIAQSMLIKAQLAQAGLASGALNDIQLPASAAGYEGISALVLVSPDLSNIDLLQQQAILNWVRAGGNLLLIPGSDPLPAQGMLLSALPCIIGNNSTVSPGPATTQPSSLNARELHPRGSPATIDLFGPNGPAEFSVAYGMGNIAVLPANIAPLQFRTPAESRVFWRKVFSGMVAVPEPMRITHMEIGDAQEDVLRTGPGAEDTYGRGPRETVTIRNLLKSLEAFPTAGSTSLPGYLPFLAGLFFLLGPLDSILLMRLGQPPRHWLTVVGWIGLLASLGGWAMVAVSSASELKVKSFRLIDQVPDGTVARVDLVSILSLQSQAAPMLIDQREWWEPANQWGAMRSADRFVELTARENQSGCRPEGLSLVAGDARSLRGEIALTGPAMLEAHLAVARDGQGNSHVTGKITNRSTVAMTEIQISTSAGTCRIAAANLDAGATIDVNESLTRGRPIEFKGLPADVLDISPDRADLLATLQKSLWICVYAAMPDAKPGEIAQGAQNLKHTQILRAAVVTE